MAATTWSVQIRMMTSSTAPTMFGKMAKAAREASTAVEKLDKQLLGLDPTIAKVEPAITRLNTAFKGMGADTGRAFRDSSRSAARFSRTVIAASRVSRDAFGEVRSSIGQVRSEANQASWAIRNMAAASRSVPRAIGSPKLTTPTSASGHGGGSAWMDPGAIALAMAGAGAGGALFGGIRTAADMQQMEAQLNISGIKQSDMPTMRRLAMQMSSTTAQSVSDSMMLLKVMSSGGLNSIPGVNPVDALKTLAMPIARYADVNYLATGKKHMEFEESATLATGLAHDMRLYTPQQMTPFLQTLARASYESNHGPAQLGTVMRAFAPLATNVGMSPEDIVNYAALIDRSGQITRGGTGMNMLIKNLQAPRGSKKMGALVDMGIYNANGTSRFINEASGNVDVDGFLRYVASYRDRMKLNKQGALAGRLEARGFDTNSARLLDAVGTKGMLEMLGKMRENEKTMPTLQQMQQRLMVGLNSQTKLLISNFHTLMATIADPLIPSLTQLVSNLAQLTGDLASFFASHPHAAQAAGIGIGAVAVAGSVAALAVGGMIAHGAMHSMIGKILGHGSYGLVSAAAAGGTGLVRGGMGAGFGGLARRGGSALMSLTGLGVVGAGKGLFSELTSSLRLVSVAAAIGGRSFLFSRAGMLGIVEVVTRLGLKAVPVVGEVLMLIDTIRFLGDHAKEIGGALGTAVGWIRWKFGPMLWSGIQGVFSSAKGEMNKGVLGVLGDLKNGIVNTFVSIINWFREKAGIFGAAFGAAMNAQAPPGTPGTGTMGPPSSLRSNVVKMATGGRVNSEGLAYLHRNEVVVHDHLTRKLERMTSGRGGSGGVIHVSLAPVYNAPAGESDAVHRRRSRAQAKELAQQVAATIADALGLDMRSGGATPQLAGFSHHALLAGQPS